MALALKLMPVYFGSDPTPVMAVVSSVESGSPPNLSPTPSSPGSQSLNLRVVHFGSDPTPVSLPPKCCLEDGVWRHVGPGMPDLHALRGKPDLKEDALFAVRACAALTCDHGTVCLGSLNRMLRGTLLGQGSTEVTRRSNAAAWTILQCHVKHLSYEGYALRVFLGDGFVVLALHSATSETHVGPCVFSPDTITVFDPRRADRIADGLAAVIERGTVAELADAVGDRVSCLHDMELVPGSVAYARSPDVEPPHSLRLSLHQSHSSPPCCQCMACQVHEKRGRAWARAERAVF